MTTDHVSRPGAVSLPQIDTPVESDPITVSEIKALAQKKLQRPVWEYYDTGADEQKTLVRNEIIYNKLVLRPRVLRDVSTIDTSTTIFGKRYAFPLAIAPSAYQRLVGDGGETEICCAAQKLGLNYILSSNATTSLEEVIQAPRQDNASDPKFWFQLYVLQDRDVAKNLIQRAEKAGYKALVVTVDTPVMGNRLQERKSPLILPSHLSLANLTSEKGSGSSKVRLILNARTAAEAADIEKKYHFALTDASLTWDDFIPWLRANTTIKIILKGIMTGEDASLAMRAGVDAIVVSNHGGRQLDGVSSTLEALPEIVDEIQKRIPVIFDGGIDKGSDVFKALALGADLCLVGRSALWGLAYNGQKGVEAVLNILERELVRTMTLVGAQSLKDISRDMLGVKLRNGFGISRL